MSFVVGGITFYEPSDHGLVSIASTQGFLGYNGDTVYRIAKSDVALASHTAHVGTLTQAGSPHQVRFLAQEMRLGSYLAASIRLYDTLGWVTLDAPTRLYLGLVGCLSIVQGNTLTTPPATGKTYTSDGFLLHASWAKNKEKIKPITTPKDKLKKIEGKTFTVSGKEQTGYLVDDLVKVGLPGIVESQTIDDDVFEAYNPLVISALHTSVLRDLIETVEALSARLDKLEKQTP